MFLSNGFFFSAFKWLSRDDINTLARANVSFVPFSFFLFVIKFYYKYFVTLFHIFQFILTPPFEEQCLFAQILQNENHVFNGFSNFFQVRKPYLYKLLIDFIN